MRRGSGGGGLFDYLLVAFSLIAIKATTSSADHFHAIPVTLFDKIAMRETSAAFFGGFLNGPQSPKRFGTFVI